MGELAQSSVVRETAGQEFEPESARGDHMLYISFVVVCVCLFVCIKTNLLKALGFATGENWSISEFLRCFIGGFTWSHSVLL